MGLFCFPDTRLKRLQNIYKLACDLVAILLPGPLNIGKNESDMGFETKYLCGSSFEQKMVALDGCCENQAEQQNH